MDIPRTVEPDRQPYEPSPVEAGGVPRTIEPPESTDHGRDFTAQTPSWRAATEAFMSGPAVEVLWKTAGNMAECLHPGFGGAVVRMAFQVARALDAAAHVPSGAGFDLGIGVLETGVDGLSIAFRVRELREDQGQPGFYLDLSFFDKLRDEGKLREEKDEKKANRWMLVFGRAGAVYHDLVLSKLRALPEAPALRLIEAVERSGNPLAVSIEVDSGSAGEGTYAWVIQGEPYWARLPLR